MSDESPDVCLFDTGHGSLLSDGLLVLVHSWVFQVRVTSQSLNLGSVTRDYVVSHLRIINFLVFWSLDIVEVVSHF